MHGTAKSGTILRKEAARHHIKVRAESMAVLDRLKPVFRRKFPIGLSWLAVLLLPSAHSPPTLPAWLLWGGIYHTELFFTDSFTSLPACHSLGLVWVLATYSFLYAIDIKITIYQRTDVKTELVVESIVQQLKQKDNRCQTEEGRLKALHSAPQQSGGGLLLLLRC